MYFLLAVASASAIALMFRTRARKMSAKWSAQMMIDGVAEIPTETAKTAETKPGEAVVSKAEGELPNLSASADPDQSASRGAACVEIDFSEMARAFRIADMNFTRSNLGEAEKWFIKVLSFDPNHTEAINKLGVIYIQQKNYKRAEILFKKLFTITQKDATHYCNYGRCLYNQSRLAEAAEAYENAVKLDSTKSSRYTSVGQIYYELKDYAKALTFFSKALDLEPVNVKFLSLVAELSGLAGDNDRKQRSLRKILEIEPYNEEAKKKLGELEAVSA
jgi:tetratricopeptide (TPR) repeat protein